MKLYQRNGRLCRGVDDVDQKGGQKTGGERQARTDEAEPTLPYTPERNTGDPRRSASSPEWREQKDDPILPRRVATAPTGIQRGGYEKVFMAMSGFGVGFLIVILTLITWYTINQRDRTLPVPLNIPQIDTQQPTEPVSIRLRIKTYPSREGENGSPVIHTLTPGSVKIIGEVKSIRPENDSSTTPMLIGERRIETNED